MSLAARLLLDLARRRATRRRSRPSRCRRRLRPSPVSRGAPRSPCRCRLSLMPHSLWRSAPLWKPHERALQAASALEGEQALAADPAVHAALSASAGTGKTQVLTARVLRLLLNGARPESILCLTFTKAAAAEMANRIGERLANWVRLPGQRARRRICSRSASRTTRRPASGRGNCSPRCSTVPAASRSRPSTASRSRCSPRFRPRRGSPRASSRSRAAPSRSWCGARSPT